MGMEMSKTKSDASPMAKKRELSEVDQLPDKIEKSAETSVLPKEIGRSAETPALPEKIEPMKEKQGGRYGDIFKEGEGDKIEVHHMPADSASHLERNDGPSIKMEKEDHRKTASCGSSREAREYRAKQRELVEQGEFRKAQKMDIDDIHSKFGSKYDEGIKEMLEYDKKLEKEGKING